MQRRAFLRQLLASGALLSVGRHSWAVPAGQPVSQPLVVIFLRGAVDGLSVLSPYTEALYGQARPDLAIAAPNFRDPRRLNNQFALHPALSSVLPYWQQGSLAFVQACGLSKNTRSHFEAQTLMELGCNQPATAQGSGWMNRLLQVLLTQQQRATALNVGTVVSPILQGRVPVTPFALGRGVAGRPISQNRTNYQKLLDELYQGSALEAEYKHSHVARQRILAALSDDSAASNMTSTNQAILLGEDKTASNGAPPPSAFVTEALQIAKILRSDHNIPLVFTDVGGWDTHVNQGNIGRGQLHIHLKQLADGISQLVQALGSRYQQTTIMVISEFGRTVQQNGTGGTDHGRGNTLWLLGGNVAGGKVYGEWPTLDREHLFEQRDIPVLIDYRQVISQILTRQFSLSDNALNQIFPETWQSVAGLNRLWRG